VSCSSLDAFLSQVMLNIRPRAPSSPCSFYSIDNLKALLTALCFHQFFDGIAIGTRLNFTMWQSWLAVILFGVSAPLGMAIAVGISSRPELTASQAYLVSQGTLQAFASGMILYISFGVRKPPTHTISRSCSSS
jgi:zinc transporter ZupT